VLKRRFIAIRPVAQKPQGGEVPITGDDESVRKRFHGEYPITCWRILQGGEDYEGEDKVSIQDNPCSA
jgi:hypothetical protein